MILSMTTNLMVESVEETIEFYQEIFGFSTITTVPNQAGHLDFAILNIGNLILMLQERVNFVSEYPILVTNKTKASVSLYLTVDNFDELYAIVKKKLNILVDVHKTFYGTNEFAIVDNNGYVITIAEANSN